MAKLDDIIAAEEAKVSAQAPVDPNAPTERIRTALSGLTMGWWDELEAGVRAAILEDRPYEQIRDEIRSNIKAYQEANPAEALGIEAIGAIAPTVAAFLIPGGQPAAAANTARLGGGLMKLAGRGATEGAITGAGTSEAEDLMGVAGDTAGGATVGAVASPLVAKVGGKVAGKAADISNWIRSKVGSRPSDAAVAELQRLAAGTGKSVDEIVQDIADGKILAENKTLAAAVRAIKSKGAQEAGAAPGQIDAALRRRAGETAGRAERAAERAMLPQGASSRNVFNAINQTDEALKAAERQGYRSVFRANPELDAGASDALEKLAQRFPNLRNELGKYYDESKLVPLFKTAPNGEVTLARAPSLEDAEVFYRLMRDEGSARWTAGKGQTAAPLTDASAAFKRMLDIKYPELKAVRSEAAKRLGAADAFKSGRRAFGMDADEVQFVFDEMTPEAQANFRAGVLAAFKNKMRRSPTATGRAADPSRQEGAVLKAVLGDDYQKILQKELEIAGESAEAVNRILYGSMTAPQAAAEKAVGSGQISMSDIMGAFSLDPTAMAAIIGKKLSMSAPSLKPKDYEKITEVLLSENPKFVEDVLNDNVSLGSIQKMLESLLVTGAEAGRRAATVTGAARQPLGEAVINPTLEQLFNPAP